MTPSMVIVTGTIDVDPQRRSDFILDQLDHIRTTRAEKGCLACAYSADPLDPGRVLLLEKWASQKHFDAHVASSQARCAAFQSDMLTNVVSVSVHDVAAERWLGGWDLDSHLRPPLGSIGPSAGATRAAPVSRNGPLREWAKRVLSVHP